MAKKSLVEANSLSDAFAKYRAGLVAVGIGIFFIFIDVSWPPSPLVAPHWDLSEGQSLRSFGISIPGTLGLLGLIFILAGIFLAVRTAAYD